MPAWCKEKKIITPLENITTGQLDINLKRFYAEARTKTGKFYSKSTLLGFRHSIERFLNAPPFNRAWRIKWGSMGRCQGPHAFEGPCALQSQFFYNDILPLCCRGKHKSKGPALLRAPVLCKASLF